jgi:hypothetical protein
MTSTVNIARVTRYAGLLLALGLLLQGSVGLSGAALRTRDDKSKSGAKQPADEKKDDKDKKDEKKEETLPLKTTRKISFMTDEGTWMSTDVSPDGKQIVFDLLGDLYVIPSTGGDAKRLTIFTEWETGCVYQRPKRQRQSLADQCGRLAD